MEQVCYVTMADKTGLQLVLLVAYMLIAVLIAACFIIAASKREYKREAERYMQLYDRSCEERASLERRLREKCVGSANRAEPPPKYNGNGFYTYSYSKTVKKQRKSKKGE